MNPSNDSISIDSQANSAKILPHASITLDAAQTPEMVEFWAQQYRAMKAELDEVKVGRDYSR